MSAMTLHKFGLACVAVVLGGALLLHALSAQDPLRGWRTSSGTGALSLAAVSDGRVYQEFSLTNTSQRAITALAVTFTAAGDTHNHYIDFLDSDVPGLAPGATYGLRIASTELLTNSDRVLRLAAALFDDGSAEGDSARVAFIDLRRVGRALEFERARAILADSSVADVASQRARATERIGKLPNTVEEAMSSLRDVILQTAPLTGLALGNDSNRAAFLEGVRNAREDALFRVARVPSEGVGDERMSAVALDVAKRLAKLQAYLERRRPGR